MKFSMMSAEEHFDCAARIFAYQKLIFDGAIERDRQYPETLVPGMTHLNSWAVPQDLREQDAFEILNEKRDELIAEMEPDAIAKQAAKCMQLVE